MLYNILSQLIFKPTRYTALLNLVLTNNESIIHGVRVEENLSPIDHNITRVNLIMLSQTKLQINKEKIICFRNDYSKFRAMHNEIIWECFKQTLSNI